MRNLRGKIRPPENIVERRALSVAKKKKAAGKKKR
jgi:hypothetical protein